MTVIRLMENGDGIFVDAVGHAGYAAAGQDIVCAGISALLLGCLSYFAQREESGGGAIRVASDIRPGALRFSTSGFSDGADRVALEIMRAGLTDLAACYPQFLRVETIRNPEIHIH